MKNKLPLKKARVNARLLIELTDRVERYRYELDKIDNKERMKRLREVTSRVYFEQQKIEFNSKVLKYLNSENIYLIVNILKGKISETIMKIDNSESIDKALVFEMLSNGQPRVCSGSRLWECEYVRITNGFYDNEPCSLDLNSVTAKVFAESFFLLDYYASLLDELGFDSSEIITEWHSASLRKFKQEQKIQSANAIKRTIKPDAVGTIYRSLLNQFSPTDQSLLLDVLDEKDTSNKLTFLDDASVLSWFFLEAFRDKRYINGTKKSLSAWICKRFLIDGKEIPFDTIRSALSKGKKPSQRPTIPWVE